MTNHNNARETSGELLGVAEWIVHEYPKVADILTSTAETIERLVAERDRLITVVDDHNVSQTFWHDRAEAAETRMMVLLQERDTARTFIPKATEFQQRWQDTLVRAEAAEKRIAELESQNQQASEALERIVERSLNFELGTSKVIDMRNLASAALKGKQT